MQNNELKIVSAKMTTPGSGLIDLLHPCIDYRWIHTIPNNRTAPIAITGTWDNLSCDAELVTITWGVIPQAAKPKGR